MKYPGSKWNLARWIIQFFPPHHSYLEPFFGSGAVLFNKPRSDIETVNDLDANVINLFKWVKNDPEQLAHEIYYTPYSRQVYEDLRQEYIPECFDSFFVAVAKDEGMIGWDSYEQDYYVLSSFESDLAAKEAGKRLERLTKAQLIEAAGQCFKIFSSYVALRHRYDCLKAAIDILHDKNTGYIQMVKRIEELYTAAEQGNLEIWSSEAAKEFDRLLVCMPQEAWIQ